MKRSSFEILSTDAFANISEDLCPNGCFWVDWVAKGVGFGRLDIVFDENGVAHIYSEHMDCDEDRSFTKAVLNKLVDSAIVED